MHLFQRLPNIPKLWDGTVFIIGGGPSVKDMDLSPIMKCHVVGVNDAFKLGNWVDVTWFGDERWYAWNKTLLRSYEGVVFGCPPTSKKLPRVLHVNRNEGYGLTSIRNKVVWNKSSGGSAINLAMHLGASRIVLIGYDMKVREGQHNWHTNHKHRPRIDIYEKRFLPPFEKILSDANKLGLEILNATPDSALTIFPSVNLKDVVPCR